ncbi:MAG: tripartite tricarboxylate transporter substrate binding protein [Alcaligenaceae bacterium]
MRIRILAKTMLSALVFLAFGQNAAAQEYPSRSVKIVVGYPPGGAVDSNARLIGQLLSERWKKPVVVENRSGAGSTIATASVAQASPDGYTILLASPAHTINATMYKKLPYDTATAFAAVAKLSLAPLILIVHPSLPVQNIEQLIALAKAQPGKLNYGSSGAGTTVHLAGALFNMMAGTSIQHIPYHGGGPAITALLAGDVQIMFAGVEGLAQVKSGKLLALAITAAERLEYFGNLPTVAESGLPGFDVETWYGLYVPAATPTAVVQRLNKDVNAILREPATIDRYRKLGFEVFQSTPEQFGAFTQSELKKWRDVIQVAGATID